ncbi:Outer membrane receptor for ferrienterochelin and colicins [Bacteroidales bacterium Barb6XT]|nr:Outer membrane receptor for ferrienterochelin and colicins [Bacteroidales bacterium Barb6XT]
MKRKNRVCLLAVLMFFCLTAAFAQSTVRGKVIDELGDPIPGANILERGTTNGVVTDINGEYTLVISNSRRSVLRISFVGYNTKDEVANGRRSIDVKLEPSVINLGEVVAIGYGSQLRRSITGSVANVSAKDFNKGATRDVSDLLQGKVAGLVVASGPGDVTRGGQVHLRGVSTLQNDQGPMVVVDGIPGGDMSTVPPGDIESVSILKDASSAAIYGSRAAGGVILVTTKRGAGAKTQIDYSGYVTADHVANKPDMMNATEWRQANTDLGNDITAYKMYNADTDWFGEMFRTSISQNHSLSLSGGTPKSNYRASYSYMDREGIARDNKLKRHNFRFQFQQRAINDRLRIGLTAAGTIIDMQFPFWDDYIHAYNLPPVYPVYEKDGSTYFTGMSGFDMGNPVQNQIENYNGSANNNFYGIGDVQFDFTESFNVKGLFYKGRNTSDQSRWESPSNARGGGSNGLAIRQAGTSSRDLMELTANYNNTFGKHKLDAVAGYSWEINRYQGQRSQATDFAVGGAMGANSIQSGLSPEVSSSKNEYKLISFYARAQYNYAEKYMLAATVRRDGSSKFGANHKWGTFPSVSAAWSLSHEDFMDDVKWVRDVKLRAGYGVTGNQDGLQPYKSLKLYEAAGLYYDNGGLPMAFKLSHNANPNLKWESTSMLNVGLDFSLFDGRLGGSIEWYDKETSDMLYSYKVPTPTYIYDRLQANVGDMSNKGIEMMLSFDILRGKAFNWNTTLNLAHNQNKVTRLSNEFHTVERIYTGDSYTIRGSAGVTSHVVEVGYPIGQFFMLKCNGLDEEGNFIMEDRNEDGQITDDDRTYVGDAQPDLTFGWDNSFSWKKWDAGFSVRGSIGNKVLNNPLAAYGNNTYISGTNAIKNDHLMDFKESSRLSSFYIEDASFARLDNLSVGYTFDTKKVGWLSALRLYAAAQNVFVLTGYSGLDPEVELFRGGGGDPDAGLSPGIEARNYFPKARSFTFGANLTF